MIEVFHVCLIKLMGWIAYYVDITVQTSEVKGLCGYTAIAWYPGNMQLPIYQWSYLQSTLIQFPSLYADATFDRVGLQRMLVSRRHLIQCISTHPAVILQSFPCLLSLFISLHLNLTLFHLAGSVGISWRAETGARTQTRCTLSLASEWVLGPSIW